MVRVVAECPDLVRPGIDLCDAAASAFEDRQRISVFEQMHSAPEATFWIDDRRQHVFPLVQDAAIHSDQECLGGVARGEVGRAMVGVCGVVDANECITGDYLVVSDGEITQRF